MLTYEQRLELLKKAREAKKNKKASKIAPEPLPTEPLPEVEEEIVFEEEVEPTKKVKKSIFLYCRNGKPASTIHKTFFHLSQLPGSILISTVLLDPSFTSTTMVVGVYDGS